MKEKEIQSILEQLIQDNKFFESIKNIKQIDDLYNSQYNENFLPAFSIDYYSRMRLIRSAKNVLSSLQSAKIITTASQNVSIDRNDKIYPDLILFDDEQRKFIIVEIKRSDKTSRETLTQMLAYEHEIRNFFPFLANYEVLFCIVSTEYPTLLDHSIASLSTWESKQILCLHLKACEEKFEIEIHLPSAWTSFSIGNLPSSAIQTLNISLSIDSEKRRLNDLESVVRYASQLIAKDGDRNNSHGFALVWRDSWELTAPFHIKLGFINPYAFLPIAQEAGNIDASKSPIGQYFLGHIEDFDQYYCEKVFETGRKYLERYFNVDIEGFSTWCDDRLKSYQVYDPSLLMCNRSLPLQVELWGILGDFSRELVVHPAVEKYILSQFSGNILNYGNPFVAIPFLDNISEARRVNERGLTCQDIFDLGMSLGSLLTLYNTAIHKEEKHLKIIQASLTWCLLDIQPILLELGEQYNSSNELDILPPVVKFCISQNFEEALKSIESLIDWIFSKFLDTRHPFHFQCFYIGLRSYPLLDDYFNGMISESEKTTLIDEVIDFSKNILREIVNQCSSDYVSEIFIQNVIDIFSCHYSSSETVNLEVKSLASIIENISREKHLELYHNVLINLLDEFVFPINHRSQFSIDCLEYKHLDWTWIKKEIQSGFENGNSFPALHINSMGTIGIIDISNTVYESLYDINFSNQFILVDSSNGSQIAIIKEWKDIIC